VPFFVVFDVPHFVVDKCDVSNLQVYCVHISCGFWCLLSAVVCDDFDIARVLRDNPDVGLTGSLKGFVGFGSGMGWELVIPGSMRR